VLPATIAPPAPFPLIVAQSSVPEFVAPGITRADYRITTSAGPLVVHVVAVDPQEPTVRISVVMARDRLVSPGETVSSMAARTNAVAGVNGDYFDIGQTNQPLNVVVTNGALLRTPSKRAALAIDTSRQAGIGSFTFSGSVSDGETHLPLTTINEWPPQGGATFLTPAFGALSAAPNTLVATLEPLDTTAGSPGTYRVAAIGPPRAGPVLGPLLGFGPASRAAGPLPVVDDAIDVTFQTQPAFGDLSAAIGGGPQLVNNGLPFDDPNAPAPEERDVRFPVSGAAIDGSGELLLIAVDGREPNVSMGLSRPEFGALMRAFAAQQGMAFDSGGSATLVARVLGDDTATVQNTPSDGRERPVADGLFVYSDAGRGRNPQLIVRPSTFAALAGSTVALNGIVIDDAGHKLRTAQLDPVQVDPAPGDHTLTVRDFRGGLNATVAYRTIDRVATLQVIPDRPNPPAFGTIALRVQGFDQRGTPVVLNDRIAWRAMNGAVSAVGTNATFRAGMSNGTVAVTAGGATATTVVYVGSHAENVPAFGGPPGGWRFASVPRGAAGSVTVTGSPAELSLAYDFTGSTRAAYANASLALPGEPLQFRIDVFGDGNGAALRAAFVNRYGEPQPVTLVRRVDWQGWRTIAVALPASLNAPAKLTSLYALAALSGPPIHAAGMLRFRAPGVVVRGSP
jgi:exopolysaccharide biosynthesis protein